MTVAAVGTKLKKGTTQIGKLTSIGGLDLTADTIDSTTLDSTDGFREFEGGFKDAGEVPISGYFDPTQHQGLYADLLSGVKSDYSIEFPIELGASWEFEAIVTAFKTGAELEDLVSFEATLKVSGKPELIVDTTP
ncbi:phage tail tube protein [Micromonospora provocatoris]